MRQRRDKSDLDRLRAAIGGTRGPIPATTCLQRIDRDHAARGPMAEFHRILAIARNGRSSIRPIPRVMSNTTYILLARRAPTTAPPAIKT